VHRLSGYDDLSLLRAASYNGGMSITLDVTAPTLDRLARRARREGIDVDVLAVRLLDEATEQDPYEFIGSATGGALLADDVDGALARTGFGAPRL
jgi:hypothetical protein